MSEASELRLQPSAGRDLVEYLTIDHQLLAERLDALRHPDDDVPPSRLLAATRQVVRGVSMHSGVEGGLLPKLVASALPDGPERAAELSKDLRSLGRGLVRLQRGDTAERAFRDDVDHVAELLSGHVHHQETVLFPELRDKVKPGRLAALGGRAELRRLLSPTRPHPWLSGPMGASWVASAAMASSDRVRDLFRGSPSM